MDEVNYFIKEEEKSSEKKKKNKKINIIVESINPFLHSGSKSIIYTDSMAAYSSENKRINNNFDEILNNKFWILKKKKPHIGHL